MAEKTKVGPVVLRAGEGEKRWFFGGGVWTWKLDSEQGDISLVEVDMVEGKWTPVHTHPVSESMWVLEGRIGYRINDDEHEIGSGDFVMVPAGVPHAFTVLSPTAKVLGIQPTCECEPFYRGASEPFEGSACAVDFSRVMQSAADTGGMQVVGPPPA
ncbi:cupin domain-containing protein [Nocardioides marmorisolisilvae]|nr:cupin domain-containing protein [Nocardioides marmorisolisilvae]